MFRKVQPLQSRIHHLVGTEQAGIRRLMTKLPSLPVTEIRGKDGKEYKAPLSVAGPIQCSYYAKHLLDDPRLNKGSCFTKMERVQYGLEGLLPPKIDTTELQFKRAYRQFSDRDTPLAKNNFLTSLKYQNHVLYYGLVLEHLTEMMSIIYTPTEGEVIEQYSQLFRRPDGVFLDIKFPDQIEDRLSNWARPDQVDYVVVTDGEEILGIGDQGVGGIGISDAKLTLMTLCAGVHPSRVMPVVLDVGTDSERLLQSELYLGNQFKRVRGSQYYEFVDLFVQALRKRYPNAFLHFEDFGLSTAKHLLDKYRPQMACFNDDIQGTGCVAVAAMQSALMAIKKPFSECKTLVFGAGTAGTGVAHQVYEAMLFDGSSSQAARKSIYLMDKQGILLKSMSGELTDGQKPFAANDSEWQGVNGKSLVEVIKHAKPDILIGLSTKPGAFTQEAVQEMLKYTERPIIFPLSNPTRLHEAKPVDLMKWTNGTALIATGSPFPPVNGIEIAECNNCFAFPGIGMGCVLSRAERLTDGMLMAAIVELAKYSPVVKNPKSGALLPDIADIRDVSSRIATAVVLKAVEEGVASINKEPFPVDIPLDYETCHKWVDVQMWRPAYREIVPMIG